MNIFRNMSLNGVNTNGFQGDPRQQYGINVVSIIRGEQQINIPKGEERLYPFDKIIIVGTDEELDIFQGIMQKQEKEHIEE